MDAPPPARAAGVPAQQSHQSLPQRSENAPGPGDPGSTGTAAPVSRAGRLTDRTDGAAPLAPADIPGETRDTAGGSCGDAATAAGTARDTSGDPLQDADAYLAADAAATESLLRCWLRETGTAQESGGPPPVVRLELKATGCALDAPVRYWSLTGSHRFGWVRTSAGTPADAVTVAALLAREAAAAEGVHPAQPDSADLVGRVADSVRRTAAFIAHRRAAPEPAQHTPPFLDSEQALVLGHPLHPTPKSREWLDDAETAAYSPELRGSFPLHWYAVAEEALSWDSAWERRGRTVPAAQLTAELAGDVLPLPPGTAALLPVHPWQARHLADRDAVSELLDRGLLVDLGQAGRPWYPTSSVRTVHRPDAPAMLKLSLGLRITNSRRENLHKELIRGVEVHRLLRAGLAARWHATHPSFDVVRDPAWIAVLAPDGSGRPVRGLDVVIRHNPFGAGEDANCVAGLTSPRSWPGEPPTEARSRLERVVTALAARTGRTTAEVSVEWFARYLRQVVAPVLWLDGVGGVALEAHQQNTLVLLDPDGWPCGGRYRDNQGYYFRRSHRRALDGLLPGIGRASDTFVEDEVADERFAYYLGINNILGLIGAFGSQRLADEEALLVVLRDFLREAAGEGPSSLPERLLQAPTLRCKANLLTRLHGMDELVGPVDTQSVYVTIANPLARLG